MMCGCKQPKPQHTSPLANTYGPYIQCCEGFAHGLHGCHMYVWMNWADNLMGVGENTFGDLFNELIFWKFQKIE